MDPAPGSLLASEEEEPAAGPDAAAP
jgi:hypothetical protein